MKNYIEKSNPPKEICKHIFLFPLKMTVYGTHGFLSAYIFIAVYTWYKYLILPL